MFGKYQTIRHGTLLAGLLAGSLAVSGGADQSTTPATSGATASAAPAAGVKSAAAGTPFRFREDKLPYRATVYYRTFWGVDSLNVKEAESGELIRFSWRVLDGSKAQVIHDKKFEPVLIDPQAGVKLVVPSLEKVGQLRQSSTPVPGKSYWMAFSNKGHVVKPGDRVTIVIGLFRAEGLVVQ